MRLLLSRGITYPYLVEMVKSIFVDVAMKGFQIDSKEQTISRISLLSGVHRKDVKRLRQLADISEHKPQKAAPIGARLVSAWTGLNAYTDDAGQPLPLPKHATQAGSCSFEGLVETITKDVRPRTILDEMLKQGVVRIDDQDRVELVTEAFIPTQDLDEKLFYLSRNLHAHATAATSNVIGVDQPWLERSVHYDTINNASVAELHKLAEKAGMQALHVLNRQCIKLEQNNVDADGNNQRITFGIYFYSEPAPELSKNKEPNSD